MKKKLHGFSYDKNIANFEAFCWDKNFSKNLLFLRDVNLSNEKEMEKLHFPVRSRFNLLRKIPYNTPTAFVLNSAGSISNF